MECKRLPVDYEIRDFTLKIILLIKNSGLIVSLKHQQESNLKYKKRTKRVI